MALSEKKEGYFITRIGSPYPTIRVLNSDPINNPWEKDQLNRLIVEVQGAICEGIRIDNFLKYFLKKRLWSSFFWDSALWFISLTWVIGTFGTLMNPVMARSQEKWFREEIGFLCILMAEPTEINPPSFSG
jgi:hypothetical protein